MWEAGLARAQGGTRFRHQIGRGTMRENYDQSLRDKVRRETKPLQPRLLFGGRFVYLPICGSVGRPATCLDVGPHEGAPAISVLRTGLSKRNACVFLDKCWENLLCDLAEKSERFSPESTACVIRAERASYIPFTVSHARM